MNLKEIALNNEKGLRANEYPGRGIIIGKSPDERHLIQVYWIMGRSINSRNRVFETDATFIRTKAYDESKMADPSLIIYYPVKDYHAYHIVTNGDQTDTIYEFLKTGKTFEEALKTREFEPDPPNYTPRISGMINLSRNGYQLAILKTVNNNPDYSLKIFFNYEEYIPGYGHCIHTYQQDGNPLPPFEGEPKLVRLFNSPAEVADYYWNVLNVENRVSLLVKFIEVGSKQVQLKIINKNQ